MCQKNERSNRKKNKWIGSIENRCRFVWQMLAVDWVMCLTHRIRNVKYLNSVLRNATLYFAAHSLIKGARLRYRTFTLLRKTEQLVCLPCVLASEQLASVDSQIETNIIFICNLKKNYLWIINLFKKWKR